jgi:itaconate CoA-transferase
MEDHVFAVWGKVSRIVARLDGLVTTPRIDTHYVITEFGVANLKALSSTERALRTDQACPSRVPERTAAAASIKSAE